MYNLGDQLWPGIDEWGVRGRDFCAVDRVCGTVFDQEGEESKNRANKEGDDESVDYEEYDEAASHCGCATRMLRREVGRDDLEEEVRRFWRW